MEKSNDSSDAGFKPENARAGGPDETRMVGRSVDTVTPPNETRAGGPDETRGEAEPQPAPSQEQDNIPRGAPVDSRSSTR
ncbi:MAG: hypothetical protein ACJ74T_08355 [Pyrinomonadaceae bacterium]